MHEAQQQVGAASQTGKATIQHPADMGAIFRRGIGGPGLDVPITYDAEADRITAYVQDQIGMSEIKDIIQEVATLSKANNCFRILADLREATVQLSILKIYSLPQIIFRLATMFRLPHYKFRRALVVKKVTELIAFFETVSRNSGQYVRLFEDIELAKQWLQEG